MWVELQSQFCAKKQTNHISILEDSVVCSQMEQTKRYYVLPKNECFQNDSAKHLTKYINYQS